MSWVKRSLFIICNLIIFYSLWDYFSLTVKSSLNQNDILQSIKEYETDNWKNFFILRYIKRYDDVMIKMRYALNDKIMILRPFQRYTKLKKNVFISLLWCCYGASLNSTTPSPTYTHTHTHTHSKKIIHLKFIKYIYKIVSKK